MLHTSCLGKSEQGEEQKRVNKEINRQLKQDKKLLYNAIKLLLLGSEESGKSTFIKQMKIIYAGGYSTEEKQKFGVIIVQNVISAMQTLVKAMKVLKIPYSNSTSEAYAQIVEQMNLNKIVIPGTDHRSYEGMEMLHIVRELWDDEGVRTCYWRQKEYTISDSMSYFFANLDRLDCVDYFPTDQDILRCKQPKTGIIDYSFQIKCHPFRIFDVSGQRNQHRKWIHCFEDVNAVLFIAALSDYCESYADCRLNYRGFEIQRNKLAATASLFKKIRRSQWFKYSAIILLLNKYDLFQQKLALVPLKDHFPCYKGKENDAEEGRYFIDSLFNSNKVRIMTDDCTNESTQSKIESASKCLYHNNVYSHFTCATDTSNISSVFKTVKQCIIWENLSKIRDSTI